MATTASLNLDAGHRHDFEAGVTTASLLAHFGPIADTPDAVSRLRRFILDLAVRGKLVPQDPNDEPASELLKRIAVERARLVKATEIRKPRELGAAETLVMPFDVPNSWKWIRLDSVGAIIGGGTPSANDPMNFTVPGQGIPWLTPADLGKHSGLFASRGARDLTEKGLKSSSATLMPEGTVLFTSRAPIGYVAIAANQVSTNQGFKSIVPYVPDCARYVALAMQSFAPDIDSNAPGTTFREVSGKIVAGVPFPLPPLSEQHRIVAKVDELMALCDRLEAARTERKTARNRLAAASLAPLNAPEPDPAVFRKDVAFTLGSFTPLTIRPDQIRALRQTILNLAVRGKLVPQNPSDEPASELVKRIKGRKIEKERKTNDARMKSKNVSKVEEFPTMLPPGWAIQSFEDLFLFIDYRGKTPPKTIDGVPLITAKNIRMGYLQREPREYIAEETFKSWMTRGIPKLGDLFFTTEAPLANVCLNEICGPFALAQRTICLQPYGEVDTKFCMFALMSDLMQTLIGESATGTTARGIKAARLKPIPMPLPPLVEQHRIVAKIEELRTLCDRLEASLCVGEDMRRRLLETMLHEALEFGRWGEAQ